MMSERVYAVEMIYAQFEMQIPRPGWSQSVAQELILSCEPFTFRFGDRPVAERKGDPLGMIT